MLLAALFVCFVIMPIVAALSGDPSLLIGVVKYVGGFFAIILFLYLLTQPAFWAVVALLIFVAFSIYVVWKYHKSNSERAVCKTEESSERRPEGDKTGKKNELLTQDTDGVGGATLMKDTEEGAPAVSEEGVGKCDDRTEEPREDIADHSIDSSKPKRPRIPANLLANLGFALKSVGIYIGLVAASVFTGFFLYNFCFSGSMAFSYHFNRFLTLLVFASVPYLVLTIAFAICGQEWRAKTRGRVRNVSRTKPVPFRVGVAGVVIVAVTIAVVLCSCPHKHWADATCEEPSHCQDCGKERGEKLSHQWAEATCEEPRTCAECGKTEGEPLGHIWFTTASGKKVCKRCWAGWDEAIGSDINTEIDENGDSEDE